SSGNINIPAPDLSGKANQSDLNNTNNRVTAIETGYMKKPTVISKADYDKLATKDPNTLYEITE
ncbi:phage upper tail fiber protein, partial [Lactobacillus crispatus]